MCAARYEAIDARTQPEINLKQNVYHLHEYFYPFRFHSTTPDICIKRPVNMVELVGDSMIKGKG